MSTLTVCDYCLLEAGSNLLKLKSSARAKWRLTYSLTEINTFDGASTQHRLDLCDEHLPIAGMLFKDPGAEVKETD